MDKRIVMGWALFLLFAIIPSVYSETIPPNIWEFTHDYYNVIGEPQLSASVVGDAEYDRGETSKIFIQLMNEGLIYGFEIEEEPEDSNESANAQTELNLEYDVTTAISVRGTLENPNDESIRILSGLQQGGSLRSGEISQPMEFDIEVYENALSGTYELILNLTYQYQYDVQVEGDKEQPEIDYWYITKNQTLPIKIMVKQRADFEIEKASANIRPGTQGILHITYKNVGNERAEDAVARISLVDPFSTTDDQAFLGTLNPGDSYEAHYRITVDNDALPKSYGINTEVKYRDEHGDTQISEVMKASVRVDETVPLTKRIGIAGYVLVIAVILGVIGFYILKKRAEKK